MSVLVTDAIVLHAFDYLESSRIVRLITREGGVRSALARGARRSKQRFGTSLDLYAQGNAELHVRDGRDLDTLSAFECTRGRAALAADLGRFTGASVIAELAMRFGGHAMDPGTFDVVGTALDAIASAPSARARVTTLAAAWRLLAELGLGPLLDECTECRSEIDPDASATFSHPAGGVLCARCAEGRHGRALPAAARRALRSWLQGGGNEDAPMSAAEVQAHQRLLREFLNEHLVDERPLRALEVWEHDTWGAVASQEGGVA